MAKNLDQEAIEEKESNRFFRRLAIYPGGAFYEFGKALFSKEISSAEEIFNGFATSFFVEQAKLGMYTITGLSAYYNICDKI